MTRKQKPDAAKQAAEAIYHDYKSPQPGHEIPGEFFWRLYEGPFDETLLGVMQAFFQDDYLFLVDSQAHEFRSTGLGGFTHHTDFIVEVTCAGKMRFRALSVHD
ncbi:MAG: hypothetical protein AB7F86_08765 [Bdellovibrionales bacterium]